MLRVGFGGGLMCLGHDFIAGCSHPTAALSPLPVHCSMPTPATHNLPPTHHPIPPMQAIALMVLKQSDDPKFPLYSELPSPAVPGMPHGGPPGMGAPFHPGGLAGMPFLPPVGLPGAGGGVGMWGPGVPLYGMPPPLPGGAAGGLGGGSSRGVVICEWCSSQLACLVVMMAALTTPHACHPPEPRPPLFVL